MTSALPHSRRHKTEPARSHAPNKHTPSQTSAERSANASKLGKRTAPAVALLKGR